jgi:hypothetical protein
LQLELQGNQEAVNRDQQSKVILENALGMAESAQAALARAMNESAESSDGGIGHASANNSRPARPSEMLQQQLDSMRLRYSDDHPDVKRLRDSIVKAKAAEAGMPDRGPVMPSSAGPVPSRPVSEAVRDLHRSATKRRIWQYS